MGAVPLSECPNFYEHGDGPIVLDKDDHARPESSRLDGDPPGPHLRDIPLDQGQGHFGRRRPDKGGAASLAGIPEEGELGDHENRSGHVLDREIQLPLIVIEDSKLHRLSRDREHLLISVAHLAPHESDEASIDLPDRHSVDGNGGPSHSLENGDQLSSPARLRV